MTEQLQLLSVESLRPAKWNRDVGDVSDLAASILDLGLIEPIVVRTNGETGFEVVAGERRWRAAVAAGLTEIPTIVRELDDRQALEVQLIENLQRKDIEPLEEAEGYRRLVEFGVKQSEIASKVKRSQAHVSKRLQLLELPDRAKEALSAGKIPIEAALEFKRLKDVSLANVDEAVVDLIRNPYNGAKRIVDRAAERDTREKKELKARELFEKTGVDVIPMPDTWNSKARALGKGYGHVDVKVAAHRKEPCHAGFVDHRGAAAWACKDPERHLAKGGSALKMSAESAQAFSRSSSGPSKSKQQKEKEKAYREATKARQAKLREILGTNIPKDTAFSLLARYAIKRMLHDEAKIVCALLDIAPTEKKTSYSTQRDYHGPIEGFGKQGPAQLRRVVSAIAFAQAEDSLRLDGNYGWADARPYFAFLEEYNYAPSAIEKSHLTKAKAR